MDPLSYGHSGGEAMAELPQRAVNRNPTLTETLRAKKADLEAKLAEVSAALEALEKNPGVEQVLNLVARIR